MSSTGTIQSFDTFKKQFAPPRPPAAVSLDLDAGGVIRLTRRPDDAGYEPMTFSSAPGSAPPTPQPPAKPDEPTLTTVKRGAPLDVPAVRPSARTRASRLLRAVSPRRASLRPR